MGILIDIAVVFWLIFLLIVYVIAPIARILLTITLTLSLVYAFYISIRSFVKSLINHLDPYITYVDNSPDVQIGTKRSYSFGPGYHQIATTVKEAFSSQKSYLSTLEAWKDRHTGNPRYRDMWIWIFYCAAFFCTFVLGFVWMTVFSAGLAIVLFTGMFFFTYSSCLYGVWINYCCCSGLFRAVV